MKVFNLSLVAVFCVIGITGCANTETVLKNDKGETRYCYLSHNGSIAVVAATGEYNRCLNDAGTAGFRRVN
jgi:hypothetical protein